MDEGIGSLSLNPDTVVATWRSLAGYAPPKDTRRTAAA